MFLSEREPVRVKMWITKYLFSKGIFEIEGEVVNVEDAKKTRYFKSGYLFLKVGLDAHPDREDALIRARAMREHKIASLEKQLAKVKALEIK